MSICNILLIIPQQCCFFRSDQLFCPICLELFNISSTLYSFSPLQHFLSPCINLSLFQHFLALIRKFFFNYQHFSEVANNFTTFGTQQHFYTILLTFRNFSTFPFVELYNIFQHFNIFQPSLEFSLHFLTLQLLLTLICSFLCCLKYLSCFQ